MRLKPIHVLIPAVLIAIIIPVLVMFVAPVPGKKKAVAALEAQRDQLKQKADGLSAADKDKTDAMRELAEARRKLAEIKAVRGVPISTYDPAEALIAVWTEYRQDLPPLIEQWVERSGCRIVNSVSLGQPPSGNLSLTDGFLRIPQSGTLTLTVQGSLAQVRRLYYSQNQFGRVLTIGALNLDPQDDGTFVCTLPLVVYVLVEAPAAPAPAGGGGATFALGGGGAGGRMGGMGGGPGMGMMPGMMGAR